MDIERMTPDGAVRVVGPVLADAPDDGGKWALYCEHYDGGEWLNGGLIQDTNRRRLAAWRTATRGMNYTEWCPECQVRHAGRTGGRRH
jgi:hypothetical protein